MEVEKIKYNRELIKNKIRLEKELNVVNAELYNQTKECEHIKVVLDYSATFGLQNLSNSIMFCLKCSKDLSYVKEPAPMIDATFYKENESDYLKRLEDIREMLIKIKESNPEISDRNLIEKIQEQVDINSIFYGDGYSKIMVKCRNSNNSKLY